MTEQGGMRVATDTVVTIEYRANLTDGALVDSTDHCGPVTYLHGNEQIFPELERAVEGLMAGEERHLTLSPRESYGDHNPNLVRRIPLAVLHPDLQLEVGKRYTIRGSRGATLTFRAVAFEGNEILADFNNPAAGKGLALWVRVVAVRAATLEELKRGNVR